jgi:tetratricopeptide (TPR) repeat protein
LPPPSSLPPPLPPPPPLPSSAPRGAVPHAPSSSAVPAAGSPPGKEPGGPPAPRTETELGVARAAALFERVDPAQAAALLEPVLAKDPGTAAGWILMARIRLALDQVDEALEAAEQAVALAPQDPRPLATASRALTLLGRHEEAVTMAYRAVVVEPTNALWHDRVAWALLAAERQLADAEQAARTAVSLDPTEAHYYFTHGVALDALGHPDQARQALLISLRLEPENPVAQHRLAVLNGEHRRPPEKRGRWKLFGRRGPAGARPARPEEHRP